MTFFIENQLGYYNLQTFTLFILIQRFISISNININIITIFYIQTLGKAKKNKTDKSKIIL